MKARFPIALLIAVGSFLVLPGWSSASIVLDYRFPADRVGFVQLDPSSDYRINLDIREGSGVLTLLYDGEALDGGNARPILQIQPAESQVAETAVNDESYLSLSIKPSGGKAIALSSLEFDLVDEMGSSGYGCVIQSSVGGFGRECPVLTPRIVQSDPAGSARYCVDLSDDCFQNLPKVDFRLYFYAPKPSGPLKFDGVAVKGETIVAPEPSSAMVWFLLVTLITCVAAFWLVLRKEALPFAYATAYPSNSAVISRRHGVCGRGQQGHKPWPEHVRASILEVIDRGRLR